MQPHLKVNSFHEVGVGYHLLSAAAVLFYFSFTEDYYQSSYKHFACCKKAWHKFLNLS